MQNGICIFGKRSVIFFEFSGVMNDIVVIKCMIECGMRFGYRLMQFENTGMDGTDP